MANLPRTITNWRLHQGMFGAFTIEYACPNCGSNLSSPAADGGKTDTCPECRCVFVLPVEAAAQANSIVQEHESKKLAEKQARQKENAEEKERRRQARAGIEAERVTYVPVTRKLETPSVAMPPESRREPQPGDIICPNPNCGYIGPPQKEPRGSVAVGCLLSVIMLLPGLLYFAFMSGYNYVCPRCGLQIRSGTHN